MDYKPGPRNGGGGPQTILFVERVRKERVRKERAHKERVCKQRVRKERMRKERVVVW